MFRFLQKQFSTRIVVLLLMFALACDTVSRDEVARQTSPDGKIDAILFETNGGATTSFGYEVELRAKNSSRGTIVASLYGAERSASAYGVNLKWTNEHELVLEYLSSRAESLFQPQEKIAGRQVIVSLRRGVEDLSAPGGGMVFNLRKQAAIR